MMTTTILRLRRAVPRSGVRTMLTLSQVKGPTAPPLLTKTLPEFFRDDILVRHADQPALISNHERAGVHNTPWRQQSHSGDLYWNFAEFDAHIEALATGLSNMGIQKGDRVAAVLGNSSPYAVLQWACARIGAIIVTINPAYKMHELLSMLNLVTVKALFIVPQLRSSHYTAALLDALPSLSSSKPNAIHDPALPSLRSLVLVDNTGGSPDYAAEKTRIPSAIDFRDVLLWNSPLPKVPQLYKDDIMNLQFTSGTTGLPKAVSLTHENLLNNGRSIGACMQIGPGDKLCNVPPLFHCFDRLHMAFPLSDVAKLMLLPGNLAAWTHGACIVYAAETFDPAANLCTLAKEQCVAVHGVPTHFLGLLDELEKAPSGTQAKLSRLRTGIAAGSPIPIELMKKLIEKLNLVDLSICYGMTETSPVTFQTTPEDPLIKRVETVGRIHPHAEAKIVDEDGKVVPIGQPGEICVSGYMLFKGYWNDPEHTAAVARRHDDSPEKVWMHTGDVGVMDEEGYLRIVGRIKDVIIRGGENLFPVRIENTIGQHPDVHEVSVVSVPDTKYGEVVGAWVRLRRGAEHRVTGKEVRRWVTERMNPQNAPAWVWFLGDEEVLPMTASGKVQKNVLREWSKEKASQGFGSVI